MKNIKILPHFFGLFFVFTMALTPPALAKSAAELQLGYDEAIERLMREVTGARDILEKSNGILVIPGIWKAGFGIGGEYGEGVLKVDGGIADYYSQVSLSIGWQLGVQKRTVILVFMDDVVLQDFMHSDGWEFGVDASATFVDVGVDGEISSLTHNEPIIGFVLGQKGLMGNLTLEGYKLTKIKK